MSTKLPVPDSAATTEATGDGEPPTNDDGPLPSAVGWTLNGNPLLERADATLAPAS